MVMWIRKSWIADKLSNHTGLDPGSLIGPPEICITCKWLSNMNVPILLIQTSKLSTAQGNNRIIGRSPWEDPVVMVS